MPSLEKRSELALAQDESKYTKWMVSQAHPDEQSENIENMDLVYLNKGKLSRKIPKQIVCLDEKYLLRCLEMIHISAGKISLHTSSLKTGISLEGFVFPLAEDKYPSGSADSFIKYSSPIRQENVNSGPPGHWIIGSISGSESMKSILKHPMLNRLEVLKDDKDDSDLEFRNTVSHSIICSPQKINRFNAMYGIDESKVLLLGLGQIVSHGMLQCTLTGRNPHYVFSMDEKREVYEASVLSTESSAYEGSQWMYSFNLQNGRRKEGQVASTKELSHVGLMKASAHFTTCQNNFKISETEYVLYGLDEKVQDGSVSNPQSQSFRSNKGLSKKALIPFKPSLSVRKRTKSVFWRSSSTTDSCPWSSPTEVHKISEKEIQPYCEIASIVIRKHVNIPPKEIVVAEPGGWGASILKRVTPAETSDYQNLVNSSKRYQRCSNGNCSSTDIIIPAGYHSQPETGNGVPSRSIERWKSGGRCDCGGWDIGCPLTVFTTRTCRNASLGPNCNQKDCTSFEVVLKGKERHQSQMKMVNISGDLYYLSFQSSLSALQCFAIAVAVLHSGNAMLQTKMLQEWESGSVEEGEDVDNIYVDWK